MSKITSGALLIATGVLHCAVGLVMGWEPTVAIVADGVVAAVGDDDMARNAIFWFQFGGVMMVLLGALMREVERRSLPLPQWLGWSLVGLGLGGGLCMPASGFWLVVPQGLWLLHRRRLGAR